MNELQKCQLEILKEFIRICKENNLQYYLVGGTCLGAVRHKGFIPWDDDIDVAMPRKDYDKFITLQDQMKKPYFIQTYKSDKNYIYNFAKVRDSSTTFVENFFACSQMNHGVWIDVLPLDGMSLEVKSPLEFTKKVRWTWHQVWLMYLPSLKRKVRWKTCWKDIPLNFVAYLFSFLNINHYRNRKVDRKVTKIKYEDAKEDFEVFHPKFKSGKNIIRVSYLDFIIRTFEINVHGNTASSLAEFINVVNYSEAIKDISEKYDSINYAVSLKTKLYEECKNDSSYISACEKLDRIISEFNTMVNNVNDDFNNVIVETSKISNGNIAVYVCSGLAAIAVVSLAVTILL